MAKKLFTEGNPGRPKGSKNKVKADFRLFMQDTLGENQDRFRTELAKAKGTNFVKLFLEALKYVQPTLKSVEYREVPEIEQFLMMSPEERQQLIDKLKMQLENEQK